MLYAQHPNLPIFRFRPFDTPRFKEFTAASVSSIARAEGEARLAFENLPEHVICSLWGLVTTLTLEQQAQRAESETLRARMPSLPSSQMSQRPEAVAARARLPQAPKVSTSCLHLGTLGWF